MDDFSAEIAQPVKRGGKGAVVMAIVFALIAAGLGVWLAILLLNQPKKDNCGVQGENGDTSTANVDLYENDVKIRELIKEIYKAHADSFDGYTAEKTFDGGVEFSIGDGVIMSTNHSYGISANGMSEAYYKLVEKRRSTMDAKASSIFDKYGLKKTSEPKGFYSWGSEHYAFYEGNNIICYYGTSYGVAFECSDKRWYSEDDKALTLALADAYKKKEGKAVGFLGASTKDIEKNTTGTYERIIADAEDSVSLFYRKVGESDWKFFTGLQQGPWCEDFNTEELKEAYKGATCLDKSGNNVIWK